MSARSWFATVSAGCLAALCLGCAASHHPAGSGMSAAGMAPDDVAMHGNPNAPYILAGGTPPLIRRPTAADIDNAGPCEPEALSVEEIAADTNGTYRSVKLAFMNLGTAPCRLGGYPEVALLNGSGEIIGSIRAEKVGNAQVTAELARATSADAAENSPVVTLMPHAVAAFQVIWTTGAECSRVAEIVVHAPGLDRAFSITQPMKICTGRIQVTALRLDEGDV